MFVPVASRLLEIYAAARARPAEFVRFDPARLRFHLGTSLGDLRIPVQVAPDAAGIVQAAAAEISLLLSTHHKRFVPADELDRLLLREDYASLPSASDWLGPSGGGPDLRSAAQLGAGAHPALKGGLLCAWMGPGGRGRSLAGLWIESLRVALGEMASTQDREETPLLVCLALYGATQGAGSEVREALPGPPVDRYIRGAALTALWVAARTGITRAWRDGGRPGDDPLLTRLEAVVSPSGLLGGRPAIPSSGSTVYGCELSAGIPRAEELIARLAGGSDPDSLIAAVTSAIGAEDELSRRAELAVAVARLREMLRAAVTGAEATGSSRVVTELRHLYCAPGALAASVSSEPARRELARQMAEGAEALRSGDAAGLLDRSARALKSWRQQEPAAALGLTRALAHSEYAVAATALLCDAALERMAAPARKTVLMRRGDEAEGGADEEWEAGRLYRVSARGGPILHAAVERRVAHLFADVKDFTRRTALLGQATIADFLRREFYLPILGAAKRHFSGMQHLADRGGVSMNNLLGDAISFSGEITAMVELAIEIRRLLAGYEARLAREVSMEVVARQITASEERYAARVRAAARATAEARLLAERAPPGSPEQAEARTHALRAAAAEAALEAERDRALALGRGEGLEAGVFISYGAAPLVVTLDDEVFGFTRVAIADKINESARGTARAPAGRVRADALLAAQRVARGAPGLQHAWSVFIGRPLALPLPADVEAAALRVARAGDLTAAMRVLAAPVHEALEAAALASDVEPGDIFNSGAALSEEALEAFLASVQRTRVVRRIELDPEQIPPDLANRWWFGPGPESLVASFHPDGRIAEMFRYVGKAAFKGLAGVTVWEICADAGAPAALARALGAGWFGKGAA